MKKKYSVFTLAFMLALFLSFPVSAAQDYGVIYDETDLLGSSSLIMQGEEMLPDLSDELGIDFRVDVLTEINDESIYNAAEWLYENYDYGYGAAKEGVTLTLFLEPVGENAYAMSANNGWCVYANLDAGRGSSEELADVVTTAIAPYMTVEAWSGADMTMSATALSQIVDVMAESASDYILTNSPPDASAAGTTGMNASAAEDDSNQMEYIIDISDLLTLDEWKELETRAKAISEKHHCAVYFVMVDDFRDYGDGSVYETTYQLYHDYELGMGADRDGVIVLLSMEERDYAMFVYGDYAEYAFNSYGQVELEESFMGFLGYDDWYGGISAYLDTCDEFLTRAAEGNPVEESSWPYVAIAIVASCAIAGIVCLVLKYNMRSVFQSAEANAYITDSGLELTNQYDKYTHTTETRTKIKDDSSSSSESGGGGSGRSGKF